jgi:hypothetical protein
LIINVAFADSKNKLQWWIVKEQTHYNLELLSSPKVWNCKKEIDFVRFV